MRFPAAFVHALAAGALLAVAGAVAAQQPYPNKPIRFITPYSPGGTTTIIARIMGQKLTESWGQQVIVDNRPGGNTIIGTDALAKSPPDGYTMILASSIHVLVPLLVKAPYDPIADFAPVATICKAELVLVVNPSVPANNLKEFIAYAKSKPGELNYATPAPGGSQHIASEMLNLEAGIKTQYIPYKGAAPLLIDLLGGQIQLYFSTTVTAIPYLKPAARLKALAITGAKRLATLPDVPTFEESGLPGFTNVGPFYGILMPAGTPRPIIDKMATEIAKYLAQPDFQEKLVSQGMAVYASTPEQYAALMKSDIIRYSKIIKAANIKFE